MRIPYGKPNMWTGHTGGSDRNSWDMDRALIAAVNHKGDSDSTGAVTVFGDDFKNGAKCRKKIKKTGHYCGKM